MCFFTISTSRKAAEAHRLLSEVYDELHRKEYIEFGLNASETVILI